MTAPPPYAAEDIGDYPWTPLSAIVDAHLHPRLLSQCLKIPPTIAHARVIFITTFTGATTGLPGGLLR
jgi:hypothetical protein